MSNFIPNETQSARIRTRQRPQYAVIFDPCTPVFQAQIASAPVGPSYLSLQYTDVSLGVYTDIRVGMTVIISDTADHTIPIATYEEMRISNTPSSSQIWINEYDLVLEVGQYITVLDTYKALPRKRKGNKIDGQKSPEGQTASIKNLASAHFVLSDDVGVFNLSPEIVTLDGSTVTGTLYEIPGVTYLAGDEEDLEIEIEMPADSHTWARLTYTLSSGVTDFMVFQLIVSPLIDSTLPTVGIQRPHITRNWQGHHATCTALRNVGISDVMDGTRCVIIAIPHFDGGAVPIDPIQFVGYLSKESSATASASEKSTTFDIASIWERAGQLHMHHIAIRDVASPSAWDQINLPTPQRVVTHILARYSTVLNLCALNLDDTGNTWYAGDYNLSYDSLGDAIENILDEYKGALTQKPSGELFVRRDLRVLADEERDAAPTVLTLTRRDFGSIDYNANHHKATGRTIIGVRSFYTNRSPSIGGRAAAPSVILGSSPKTDTEPSQLMPANKTPLQLFGDPLDPTSVGLAEERAGHLQAMANTPYDFSGDAWSGLYWLNPNNFEWIEIDLPASLITRGRPVIGRHLLTGLEMDFDTGGTPIVRLELMPETRGGGGFVVGNLVPNVAALDWTVTPIQQPYSGNFGAPGSWNTTDFPPFTQDNMGGMGFPIPQDQAADQARQAAPPGTRSFAISFAESAGVQMGFNSVLSTTYTITMQGSALIADESWSHTGSFIDDDLGFAPVVTSPYGTWTDGIGWEDTDAYVDPAYRRSVNIDKALIADSITYVAYTVNYTKGTFFGNTRAMSIIANGTEFLFDANADDVETGDNQTISWAGLFEGLTSIQFLANASVELSAIYGGESVITGFTIRGTGVNPFTGDPGIPLYGDGAGYVWNLDEDGERINIMYDGSRGLYIQNAPIAFPPLYDESGTYTVTWEGDGNNAEVKYSDADHTDNQRVNLNINVAGVGAGT